MDSKVDTVDVARPRQVHGKFLPNATGTRRKNYHPIAKTSCLSNVMRNEHDCFLPRFPDPLKISIELLTSQRIKSRKRFIHQQHAWVWCQGAGKRDPLFHSTRKLVNVGTLEVAETDEFKVGPWPRRGDLSLWSQALELESEFKNIPKHVEPWEKR